MGDYFDIVNVRAIVDSKWPTAPIRLVDLGLWRLQRTNCSIWAVVPK